MLALPQYWSQAFLGAAENGIKKPDLVLSVPIAAGVSLLLGNTHNTCAHIGVSACVSAHTCSWNETMSWNWYLGL